MPDSVQNNDFNVSPEAKRVLSAMRGTKQYSRSELVESTGIALASWKTVVDELLETQAIERVGAGRATQYQLTAKAREHQEKELMQDAQSLSRPPTVRRRTAVVRPSSTDGAQVEGSFYGSRGLDLADSPNDSAASKNERSKDEQNARNAHERHNRDRDKANKRLPSGSLLSNTPYSFPVTGSIKQQVAAAAATTGKFKTIFVRSSKGTHPAAIPPPRSNSNQKTISRQHPALAEAKQATRRPIIKAPKLTPLPISSFRGDHSGRNEIDASELRKALKIDAEEALITMLSTSKLTHLFWTAFSAIANSGGGTIVLGIRPPHNEKFFIKGVRQYRELVEQLRTKPPERETISDFVVHTKDIYTARVCRKNVVVIKIIREELLPQPVYVGLDSFCKKPRKGCFILKDNAVSKCSEEECKALWSHYLGNEEADWQQSETPRATPTIKHRSISSDDQTHADANVGHAKATIRPPLLNDALRERLFEIAEPAHNFQRLPLTRLCEITTELCRHASLTADDIAKLIDRKRSNVINRIIPRLLQDPRMHHDRKSDTYYYL
ncbi:MAG: hypothetical protein WC966_09015 [Bradymonadales bacterium]